MSLPPVVLLNPPPRRFLQPHESLPQPIIGIGYIASYLRSRGSPVHVVDGKMERLSWEALLDRIAALAPAVVGVTAMTSDIHASTQIAGLVRERLPRCRIVLGGAHANALKEKALDESEALDALVFGEGELTMGEIVERVASGGDLEGIEGCVARSNGAPAAAKPRPWIQPLDSLPFPAWDLFPRTSRYPMIASRGCPFRCVFCSHNLGTKVRYRSPENIVEEIERVLESFEPEILWFQDETFGLEPKRADRLLGLMIDRGFGRLCEFGAQTRVDVVDPEFFRKLKAAGFGTIEMGIESGNPQVLRAIGKGIDLAAAEKAFALARAAGLRTWAKFILGHPNETWKTAMDTIRFAVRTNSDLVAIATMVPYPGSEVLEMARRGEGGYRLLSTDWRDYDKYLGRSLELETLPRWKLDLLQALGYLFFYLRNRRFRDLFGVLATRWRMLPHFAAKVLGVARLKGAPPPAG